MANFSPLSTLKKITNPTAGPREPGLLGRFELRRILGHGAQSVVWLAFDPRLEREVAIKLMKMEQGADPRTMTGWLQEARSVSRLTHPGIVPLFEADAHNQQPYLVFEYVEGQTLATVLGKRGALPTSEAVALALEMLEALMVAHAAGVIHRDLKPSNVMINPAGRARIMDFGIAAQAQVATGAEAADSISGTPGYLSPEAAKGLPPTVLMDVFAVGVVLAEMLSGRSLMAERDPHRAIQRVINEQLTLPNDLSADVDDRLRAIVMRGLARDPLLRHASAEVFRDELVSWLGVSPGAEGATAEAGAGGGNGTLDFLLRRMRHKTDFPALSNSIIRIQGMATSETESVGNVTSEILKDVALTNKLLRLVNSAHFARGGSISTVSRAVSLVGFNGIRNMALSLVLLERMQDKTHATVLKEEFLRALMAGSIAGELSAGVRGSEEAFIGALFQNLGRLLAEFYFPEEARAVRGLCVGPRNPVSEATASASVLGLNYETLGTGVAKAWGLPDGIQRSMRKPVGEPPSRQPVDLTERLRWTAGAANEMADILLRSEPKDVDSRLAQVAKRYAQCLGVSVAEIQATTVVARKKLIDMAAAMDLNVAAGSAASKLLNEPTAAGLLDGTPQESAPDSLSFLELHATEVESSAVAPVAAKPANHVAQILSSGIQEITDAMVDEFKLSDVLRMILETMFRALDFRHVVFCMRDPKIEALTGRFGLGQGEDTLVKAFSIPLKATPSDLFSVVCLKGADTMISDASEPHLAQRLPAWYRKSANAPTFLLLPLMIKGRPFGLIYADKAEKGGLVLDEKELALLRTLRNQAVVAFKQST